MRAIKSYVSTDFVSGFGYFTYWVREEKEACAKENEFWLNLQYQIGSKIGIDVQLFLGKRKAYYLEPKEFWRSVFPYS